MTILERFLLTLSYIAIMWLRDIKMTFVNKYNLASFCKTHFYAFLFIAVFSLLELVFKICLLKSPGYSSFNNFSSGSEWNLHSFLTTDKFFFKCKLVCCVFVEFCKISQYSRFRLIGPPVNQVSHLIGPNCEERNAIKDNALC